MRALLLGALAIVASTLEVGCGWGCTEIGCDSGVMMAVGGIASLDPAAYPVEIEACGNTTCATFVVKKSADGIVCEETSHTNNIAACRVEPDDAIQLIIVPDDLEEGDEARAGVRVMKSGGELLLAGEKKGLKVWDREVNGPSCGVTCTTTELASFDLAP